jgi:hypothetical protein
MKSRLRADPAPQLNQLLNLLRSDLESLRNSFIAKWLPAAPEHQPKDYEHDLKAYCVLCHASMEEFVEQLSAFATNAIKKDSLHGSPSRSMVALLASYAFTIVPVDEEVNEQKRLYDLLREGVDAAAKKHHRAIDENHGLSLKYLRKLLTPVGIDVPDEARMQTALATLAEARGSFAHGAARDALYGRPHRAKRSLSPEDAKNAVDDCLLLCEKLTQRTIVALTTQHGLPHARFRVIEASVVLAQWTVNLDPDPDWYAL